VAIEARCGLSHRVPWNSEKNSLREFCVQIENWFRNHRSDRNKPYSLEFSCGLATWRCDSGSTLADFFESQRERPIFAGRAPHIGGHRPCALGGSVVTKFWWLSLRGGSAVIVEAESMTHARLLAVVNDMGRASHFTDGYPIDAHLLELIPEELIECKLSPAEANELLDQLRTSELEGPDGRTVARTDRAAIAASASSRSP
jgi:hypothetical protein